MLIAAFNYYYTFLQLEPKEMAEQLKRQGASIPGIRPGRATAEYVGGTLQRMSILGSAFLAALSAAPQVVELITKLQVRRSALPALGSSLGRFKREGDQHHAAAAHLAQPCSLWGAPPQLSVMLCRRSGALQARPSSSWWAWLLTLHGECAPSRPCSAMATSTSCTVTSRCRAKCMSVWH